ncbi:hypothetical protein ACPA54_25680 [Uniformispora flossi]|uniref:hypothetical protein n=1 Tax=Uniformispora flossi TaxID=3390723 RepID=UPI003C2FE5A7
MIIKTTFTHTWRSGAATVFAAYPQRIRWMLVPVLVLMPVVAVATQHGTMLAWMTLGPLLMLVGHALQIRNLIKHGAIDIVLDDDGFTREQPGKTTATMRWSATLEMRWQYGLPVIRTAPRCVATVPASAFNPEQHARLAEFMDARFPQTAAH